jgi:hypothetical protein
MATDRQIAANRENAKKSTGPRTGPGKRRSRRNAFRHGLNAESVITVLEDEAAYRKFEKIVIGDYAPETAIERALVVRLASLLWRLRRAVAIETGLFQIQGRIIRDRYHEHDDPTDPLKIFYDLLRSPNHRSGHERITDGESPSQTIEPIEAAVCFLRLENFNSGMLELVGRYETRLWRQLAQTILVLESLRRTSPYYRGQHRPRSLRPASFLSNI